MDPAPDCATFLTATPSVIIDDHDSVSASASVSVSVSVSVSEEEEEQEEEEEEQLQPAFNSSDTEVSAYLDALVNNEETADALSSLDAYVAAYAPAFLPPLRRTAGTRRNRVSAPTRKPPTNLLLATRALRRALDAPVYSWRLAPPEQQQQQQLDAGRGPRLELCAELAQMRQLNSMVRGVEAELEQIMSAHKHAAPPTEK